MKIVKQHIIVIFAALLAIFVSCRKDEAKVIPRKQLSKIYAEMLVTDQWINSTPGVRLIADTSLVYEPILEKYGYNSEDYRKTIDVYMDDPKRFARVFDKSVAILDARIKELRKELAKQRAISRLPKVKSDFRVEEFVPYWGDEPYVHYYDSLEVYMDSATRVYKYVSIERGDTLYDRIRMVKPDSLFVADSLAVDSLKTDSLKVGLLKAGQLDTAKRKADLSSFKTKFRAMDRDSVRKINLN